MDPADIFDRVDLDDDGELSQEEVKQAMQRSNTCVATRYSPLARPAV